MTKFFFPIRKRYVKIYLITHWIWIYPKKAERNKVSFGFWNVQINLVYQYYAPTFPKTVSVVASNIFLTSAGVGASA